jgi:hypothetical protein
LNHTIVYPILLQEHLVTRRQKNLKGQKLKKLKLQRNKKVDSQDTRDETMNGIFSGKRDLKVEEPLVIDKSDLCNSIVSSQNIILQYLIIENIILNILLIK